MESIDEGDFVIRVRPTEINGEWTGEIDISIISQANNPLDDEGYTQLMHFCKMMCATIPLMEANQELRELVQRLQISGPPSPPEPHPGSVRGLYAPARPPRCPARLARESPPRYTRRRV